MNGGLVSSETRPAYALPNPAEMVARGGRSRRQTFILATILAALPALLLVYMPRPPVPGSHFLVYPAMAAVLTLVAALLVRERPIASPEMIGWLLVLLLYSIVTGLSWIANASELRGSAPAELFKPFVYGVFLVYGYLVARRFGVDLVTRGLVWAAVAILVGQTFLALTQALDLPVFQFIYQSEKSHPFGLLLRVTGSLANPNTFAWMVAQSAVILSLMHGSRWRRGAWITLATFLVLISGSRTLLLFFPFMLVTAQVLRDPTNLRTYVRYLALALALLVLFAGVIVFFGRYFPYLAQLKVVATSGSLASVNSFAARLAMWSRGYEQFSAGGLVNLLVGLGSRESTAVMDNDFLYVFFRLGVVGAVLHFSMVAAALLRFLRGRSTTVAVLGGQYVIFCLAFGLVSESTASWYTPLLMFALLGSVIGFDEAVPAVSRLPATSWRRRREGLPEVGHAGS